MLFITWCYNLERMPEFLGFRFNYRVGQFDHLSKKNLSFYQNFQKLKIKEKKKMYLMGALDSAQFFIA